MEEPADLKVFNDKDRPTHCSTCLALEKVYKCDVCFEELAKDAFAINHFDNSRRTDRKQELVCKRCMIDKGYSARDTSHHKCEVCGELWGTGQFDDAAKRCLTCAKSHARFFIIDGDYNFLDDIYNLLFMYFSSCQNVIRPNSCAELRYKRHILHARSYDQNLQF